MSAPPAGLQVIRRAATILRVIGEHGGGMRLADLAPHVDLPKTTIHRVVNALADERLLHLDGSGRIWLGADLAVLSRTATADLATQIRPAVLRLHRALDETVDVAVLEGATVRFIDQLQSTRPLRVVSAVGGTFPLHATANGKALLASLPPAEAASLMPSPLAPLTPHTIIDSDELRQQLDQIRIDGVAYDHQEHTPGISAAGAAVVGPSGPLLAISVPAPTERFAERRHEIVEALRRAVVEASELLDVG